MALSILRLMVSIVVLCMYEVIYKVCADAGVHGAEGVQALSFE